MKVIAVLCLFLSAAIPASAQNHILVDKSAGEHVDEALESLLGTLRFVMRAIPQYELPEVLPNGDILIRRILPEEKPEAVPEKETAPDTDGTRT